MEKITWTEKFSVGIAQIDAQHQRLIRMINRILAEQHTTTKSEIISELLDDMTSYAQEHFTAEEGLMRQYNYPHLKEHIAEHHAFREKIIDFCMNTIDDDRRVPDRLLEYLRDWLVNHILKCDMTYKPFFREKGLT